jgi:outer membrane protein assembly factor BamE (lipoprotein component of BamABCDE complex)
MLPKTIFVCLILILCLGCATNRNQRIAENNFTDQIKEGVTTKEEIRAMFGEPSMITPTSMGDVWVYSAQSPGEAPVGQQIAAAMTLATSVKRTSMSIFFNPDGTVKNKTIVGTSYWRR